MVATPHLGYSGRLEDGYHGGAVLGTARRPPWVTALLVEVVERIGTRKARRDPWAGATGRAGERERVRVGRFGPGREVLTRRP